MSRLTLERIIDAPIERVFRTVATIDEFQQAIPGIVKVEILSEGTYGVGTRFRETRVMKGKEAAAELEVTELVENEHIRLVSDSHGTVWDSVFTVETVDAGTRLRLEMEARPYKLMAKVSVPLMMKMMGGFLGADLDAVKAYCEAAAD